MKKIIVTLVVYTIAITTLLTGCIKKEVLLTTPASLVEVNVQLVPIDSARSIAINFSADSLYGQNKGTNHYPFRNTLHGNNTVKDLHVLNDSCGNPAIYVFNFANDAGFLFVSADYGIQPILAFIEHGEFRKDIVPSGLIQWLSKTMEDIETVRKGLYDNSKVAQAAWGKEKNAGKTPPNTIRESGVAVNNSPGNPPPNCKYTYQYNVYTVGPLLSTTWGQECTYNELCGAAGVNYNCNDAFDCSTKPCTGCVATATAQIINYWHPTNGYAYNYTSMPATTGSAEVQRMMRDIGLPANVNMQYNCNVNKGSGADPGTVPAALKNNFGFTSANYAGYTYNTVVNNISNSWPVLLTGCMTQNNSWFIINWYTYYSDCHEWVCDGYTSTTPTYTSSCNPGTLYYDAPYNVMFHMNWGWHEVNAFNDFNGWFAVNNWTITGAGANGTNMNFQYANSMTTEIHP